METTELKLVCDCGTAYLQIKGKNAAIKIVEGSCGSCGGRLRWVK